MVEFTCNGWGFRASYGNGVIGIHKSIFNSWHPQNPMTKEEFISFFGTEIATPVLQQLNVV